MTIIDRLKKYAGLNRDTDRCPSNPCITVREAIEVADNIEQLNQHIAKLEDMLSNVAKTCAEAERRLAAAEARYKELHNAARRCLRYDGVDPAKFNESMRHMDALIQRHIAEIKEMEEPDAKQGEVCIEREALPQIRDAIDKMISECRK